MKEIMRGDQSQKSTRDVGGGRHRSPFLPGCKQTFPSLLESTPPPSSSANFSALLPDIRPLSYSKGGEYLPPYSMAHRLPSRMRTASHLEGAPPPFSKAHRLLARKRFTMSEEDAIVLPSYSNANKAFACLLEGTPPPYSSAYLSALLPDITPPSYSKGGK